MPSTAMMFPIKPGQAAAAREFAAEILGPRRAAWETSAKALGFTRDEWHLQSTPGGDVVIAFFESPDPLKTMRDLGVSTDPFDVWFRERVVAITGHDLATSLPAVPDRFFEWRPG